MATTRTFSDMLNDYLTNALLREELVKRDYLLNKVEKKDDWSGGPLIVPFQGAHASSVSFGSLTDSANVSESVYVRGSVDTQKEVWGTMVFNHRDLMEHGKVSEQNFLKILPDEVDSFMDYMKNVLSTNLLNGAHVAKVTDATNAATGILIVDRPDRIALNQEIYVDDDNDSISAACYVRTINMNTKAITLYDARTAGSVVNLSTYTVAQNAKLYNAGALTASFSSLREALLSLANGGSTNLYGQAKTAYPYLQAINVSGAAVTSANIVEKCFDALTQILTLGKGRPTDIVMSYTNLGHVMKAIEASKGSFNVTPGSQKASEYGWFEIQVGSVTKGLLNFVGVQECDNDIIMFIDWRALSFHSNGFFKKRSSPDGTEFFEVRATTGYSYLVDICCFGELVVKRPSYCGIMYSISIA